MVLIRTIASYPVHGRIDPDAVSGAATGVLPPGRGATAARRHVTIQDSIRQGKGNTMPRNATE
jgi:hypothetical protein